MGGREKSITRIVASLTAIFLIGLLAGQFAEAQEISKTQPVSNVIPANPANVKYNTITDRADTLDRHPVLMDNPSAHNPSYQELMAFLKSDDTVNNKYDYPNYTCANFVVDLQHKAESKGINCGYAGINFRGKETGHAINVFPTTDAGLVYVDLTGGKMIISKNLRKGMKYFNMGVIESVKIYW
ncbi:hypothetical protein RCIX2607 [Methanocella arvoryzae MRE50]|uniref:Uncharacterized protein n=2 Tax=Methanocella TaxID=570266 RepID=Q0W1T4_METAR|nr:hypothetical protein RCIX2607 [Methanocella arvoryzae MRE50]